MNNTTTLGGGSQTAAYTPLADMVEEFKVQTASFDAGVGFTAGAVVNLSVKPGSRDFHGTAHYFKILPGLNANQFFANRAGLPRTEFKYNRWGGTTTGPVYIPKLYDGQRKTFYSFGYEGHHDAPPRLQTLTVPTPEELRGDFSALLAAGGRYQIYDPRSARLLANGRIQRDPFPGNIVPVGRVSSFMRPIGTYWGGRPSARTSRGTFAMPSRTTLPGSVC